MRRLLQPFLENKLFIYGLLVINFFGTAYGFYWYSGQFVETPLYFWPFVPNSPLSSLWFFFVLLLILKKRRAPFLEGLAYVGLIKHGLWTVVIVSAYGLSGLLYAENYLLWFGHAGMALQAVLFWYYFGLPLLYTQAAAISGWYLFNDYLDYVVGIYPRVDTTIISLAVVRGFAFGFTITLTILCFYTAWRHHAGKEGT